MRGILTASDQYQDGDDHGKGETCRLKSQWGDDRFTAHEVDTCSVVEFYSSLYVGSVKIG